jgi:hypothetical protein
MTQKKAVGFLLVFAIAVGWYSSLSGPSVESASARDVQRDEVRSGSLETRSSLQLVKNVTAATTPERPLPVLDVVREAPALPQRPNDGVLEDEMARNADAPGQREWRDRYRLEAPDERWTKQMQQELTEKGQAVLRGNVKIDNLDCHETVCRMYLEFEREPDAEIFLPVAFESLAHRSHAISTPGDEGQPPSSYAYEVLVERPRPDDLPQRPDAKPPTTLAISVSASGQEPQ